MNNILLKLFCGCFLLTLAFTACKKDDITGDVQDVNIYKGLTTYEFLQSHPSFDTLVQMIDAAGMKDKINAQGASFFPPTDWTIYNYMSTRTLIVQNTINQNSKWGLDSMLYYLSNNIKGTRDSLQMYLIAQPLTYDRLTETGMKYPTGLANDTAVVSYKTVTSGLGYDNNFSSPIRVVYYTHPYKVGNTLNTADILCTTSGILTKNGVVHVLSSGHSLFFRQ